MHKGKSGKFRQALEDSGFLATLRNPQIYNDRRKTFRRLKLWCAENIFDASITAQSKLEAELRKQFGTDILEMYFVKGDRWHGQMSLCVKLKL